MKDDPLNFKPRTAFNCENTTVIAAAEQKPDITGPLIKSIKKPVQVNKIKNFSWLIIVSNQVRF